MTAALAASLPAVTLPLLDAVPGVRYAVTTRDAARPLGGDMSFSTGRDNPAAIVANRIAWLATVGATAETTAMSGLIHGTRVTVVTKAHAGRGVRDPATTIPDSDGLITAAPGLTLGMCFADCTPLLLVDPVRRVIGLGHAGWRGTLADMPGALVTAMTGTFGSQPADLIAGIGPAIGPAMYEVGPDVAEPFAAAFPAVPVLRPIPERPGKAHLDLWAANAALFVRAGLHRAQIGVSGICTLTHGDRFFSHRYTVAHGEREGRFAVFLRLDG